MDAPGLTQGARLRQIALHLSPAQRATDERNARAQDKCCGQGHVQEPAPWFQGRLVVLLHETQSCKAQACKEHDGDQ